jgi:hypothetical protein
MEHARLIKALEAQLNSVQEKNESLWDALDALDDLECGLELDLYEAAKEGDIDRVNKLVEEGEVDLDWPNPEKYDYTALHAASYVGNIEVVSALITAGAYLDSVDEDGMTPLILSTFWGHANIALALLEAGADPAIREEVPPNQYHASPASF